MTMQNAAYMILVACGGVLLLTFFWHLIAAVDYLKRIAAAAEEDGRTQRETRDLLRKVHGIK